ncbi:hypothetical protein [Heliomicrobium modesticaldum]|nr:hypothetical protein [Heliomicrobium modesticaldum]
MNEPSYWEKGSVPLALIVLIVLITTSTSLAGYIFREITLAKANAETIQMRYVAEAGAEHFIHRIKELLRQREPLQVPHHHYSVEENQVFWIPATQEYLSFKDINQIIDDWNREPPEISTSQFRAKYNISDVSWEPSSSFQSLESPSLTDVFTVNFTVTAECLTGEKRTQSLQVTAEFRVSFEPSDDTLVMKMNPADPEPVISIKTWRWI